MGRTIISTAQGGPGAPYDRASPDACTRHDLQARTLSSRRTTPEKFEERRWRKGTASGEDFGTNQGEGNHARIRRPSKQLYNGTEGGSHFGGVTPGQSLRGSHSGAVTSGQSLHSSRLTPVVSDTLRDCSSHCRCPVANSPRRHNVSVIEVCSILPCQPPPLLSDRPTMHCQY